MVVSLFKRMWTTGMLAVALWSGMPSLVSADTIYSTIPDWTDGTISPFGNPDTSTYGQTFVAPLDNVLQEFSFFLIGSAGVHLEFQAQVYAWSGPLQGFGGQATGPALFTSPTIAYDGDDTYQQITAVTGGTPLTAGNSYVALFTVSDPANFANSNGTISWAAINNAHGANNGGGGFVFYNHGNNSGALNTSTWDTFGDFGDAEWIARFTSASAVPEPSSLTLLGLGLLGMARFMRRKSAAAQS